ncbi:putative membrane protein [Alkalihalobacillus xiaoxiensis]|uniref:Membrane protein n=1 Tax=Shouchella xiaoxiensis TaxID=766895 RepID=A0ABS2SNZ8_9BACI|nr:DUF819 family protein [Shouchella xiaoxiensis]MBM7837235.1 putative membrane protein [Shouchella xiaoxiensis]
MDSLIHSESTLLIWMVVISVVALALTLEKKFTWAAKISATMICLFAGLALANVGLIPFESTVYSNITGILLPLSIPLLLLQCDLRKIFKESGHMFITFNVVAVACFLGALLIPLFLGGMDGIKEYAAAQTGGWIGGTVNVVSLSQVFALNPEWLFGITIVGNLFVGLMIGVQGLLYQSSFFKKHLRYGSSEEDMDHFDEQSRQTEKNPLTIVSIFQALAVGFIILAASSLIADQVNSIENTSFVIQQIFGNIYILMTIITTILATLFPKILGNISGADKIGMVLLLMWFVTVGTTANIGMVIESGVVVFLLYTAVTIFAALIILSLGKVFKWRIENMFISLNACIGGPPTVVALIAAQKWRKLLVPAILVALYGIIIGNIAGIAVGNIWGALPFTD